MAECKFYYNEDKQAWICSVCGRMLKVPKTNTVHAVCVRKPSLARQAINYTKAVVKHIATGAKTCTDEEVEERLKICQSCDFFNLDKQYCKLCGCNCNTSKSPFVNKLRMQSQKCPRGKWV